MKKAVLLTGASRGIGKAILKNLKKDGYRILAPSRRELDLKDENSIKKFVGLHKKTGIDIIINNAGVNSPQWIEELEDGNLEETINVNLLGPIKLIRAFVGKMKKKRWGRIVNVSSIFGIVARGKQVPYVSTKHAINGVTKTLALELAQYNILVNSVCPGFVATDLVLQNSKKKIQSLTQDIPLGRLAKPAEIAHLVLFLVSDKNTYMTGSVIVIDGGYSSK